MRTTSFSIFAISLLAVAACGSAGTASPTTEPFTTDPVTSDPEVPPATTEQPITIDDIELDGEPAGPLFGVSAASEDGDGAASEVCTTQGTCGPDVVDPPPPFVPEPEHQPFCSLLAEMEERPFPDDDFEQLVVVQAWFRELRPLAPVEITEPFDVLIEFIDDAVSSQTFDIEGEIDADVEAAGDALSDFVDNSC